MRAGHYKTITSTGGPRKTRRRLRGNLTGRRGGVRGGNPGFHPPIGGKKSYSARPAPTMMFPGLLAPHAGYPSLLRPTPTLTLPQSLQSAFSGHSSFLVEDLIRISRPPAYLPRSVPTATGLSPPRPGPPSALTDTGASDLGSPGAGSRRGGSPQTIVSSASEPTFLKFGVNAILSSTPRTGK